MRQEICKICVITVLLARGALVLLYASLAEHQVEERDGARGGAGKPWSERVSFASIATGHFATRPVRILALSASSLAGFADRGMLPGCEVSYDHD